MSGHYRRKYKNGESTKKDVMSVLQKFKDNKIPITIRYTIHKDNYYSVVRDLIKIQEYYKSTNLLEKIVVSFFTRELESLNYNRKFKTESIAMFKKYKIPICNLNCDICLGCNYKNFDGIQYAINNISLDVKEQAEYDIFSKSNIKKENK